MDVYLRRVFVAVGGFEDDDGAIEGHSFTNIVRSASLILMSRSTLLASNARSRTRTSIPLPCIWTHSTNSCHLRFIISARFSSVVIWVLRLCGLRGRVRFRVVEASSSSLPNASGVGEWG